MAHRAGKAARRAVRARYHFEGRERVCYYCGLDEDELTYIWEPSGVPNRNARLTVDHVLPISRGGTNDLDNLVLACQPCNVSKGNSTLDEFLNA